MNLLLLKKSNTEGPHDRKRHIPSSLTTLKYGVFTKKAVSQNQLCRQVKNSPTKHKIQPATQYHVSCSAAITK